MRLGVSAALAGGELVPGDVEIEDGVVRAVGVGAPASPVIAAPGFVDLHVNGFAGADFLTEGAAGIERAADALRATGVTAFRPTLITGPVDRTLDALRDMGRARVTGMRGVHLEGPFLAEAMLRVHPPGHRRDPDAGLLRDLLDAGPVAQVTLAPELPGALELVDLLRARGVTATAGHSDATAAQAREAFDRGVAGVVHVFNAMRAPTAREPGLAGAALADPRVQVQLVADGLHVHDDLVRLVFAAAPGRVALVTDATAGAAARDGAYRLGVLEVERRDGVMRDAQGRLAGSTLTMDAAVRHVHALGVPLPAALTAASPGRAGLAPGDPADVVVLDDRLEVVRTLTAS